MKRLLQEWCAVLALLASVVQLHAAKGPILRTAASSKEPPTAKRIGFTVFLTPPVDPFSDLNQVGLPPGAPLIVAGASTVGWLATATQDTPLLTGSMAALAWAPPTFRRGEVFTLHIVGVPRPGFHTYPMTQRAEKYQQESGLTRLLYQDNPGLKALPPVRETEPEFALEEDGVLLEYKHAFEWSQDILVEPDARPGPMSLSFQLALQVCNDQSCVQGTHSFMVPLQISGEPALPLTPELQERSKAGPVAVAVVPVPEALQSKVKVPDKPAPQQGKGVATPTTAQTVESQDLTQKTLLGQILWTMTGAFAMLFTPCVFPMIPVTISFFLHQGEGQQHQKSRTLLLALVYSGTIVAVLTLAVLLLGSLIIGLANNPWLNLGFGVLLLYFALSLFGMYEIELPSFLSNFTLAHEGQGLIGAVFMALTFTITSFTCTGPFLGVVLTPVAAAKLGWSTLVLLSLIYSVTFASPFFLLALFPRFLKAMPKSGGWLNAVKVVMGFIEVAAAFKFLSIADAVLNPGNPRWFTYDTVLCSWIALSVACGLYLLGVYRLPHDTPTEHVGVPRLMLASFFFALAVHMTPNLWHANSAGSGVLGEFLTSMLPAPSRAAVPQRDGPGKGSEPEPNWYPNYEMAWKQAVAQNKLLFIDFTGVNCQNCRYNENNVFPLPEVRKLLGNYVCVQIYNDSIPDPQLSATESQRLAARNLQLQEATFDDVTTPLYVVFKPDKKTMEADGKFQGVALSKHSGKIDDVKAFVDQVLKAPLGEQVAQTK